MLDRFEDHGPELLLDRIEANDFNDILDFHEETEAAREVDDLLDLRERYEESQWDENPESSVSLLTPDMTLP